MHTYLGGPARASGPAVENGQLAARARSGLVDARGVDAVLPLLHDLLLSAFNTLQATGTTHLCPAPCSETRYGWSGVVRERVAARRTVPQRTARVSEGEGEHARMIRGHKTG